MEHTRPFLAPTYANSKKRFCKNSIPGSGASSDRFPRKGWNSSIAVSAASDHTSTETRTEVVSLTNPNSNPCYNTAMAATVATASLGIASHLRVSTWLTWSTV